MLMATAPGRLPSVVLSVVTPVPQSSFTSEVIIGWFAIPANDVGPSGSMYTFAATGLLGFPPGQTITVNVRIGASNSNLSGREIMSTGNFTTTTKAAGRLYSIDGTVFIGGGGNGTAMGFINESASSASPPPGAMSAAHPCGATFGVTVTGTIYIVITARLANSSGENDANVQNGTLERVS